jgi:hypothetical protein
MPFKVINTLKYLGNIKVRTAKSADYLGNAGEIPIIGQGLWGGGRPGLPFATELG